MKRNPQRPPAGAKQVTILRLGHRPSRDKRITTHCGLVARALGAQKMIICGERDDELVGRLNALCKKWGGKFKAEYAGDWKAELRAFDGAKVHLTMYGEDFRAVAKKLSQKNAPKKIMLLVGAGKVPPEAYRLCDYNASAGNQPHSEVAAIALFLYELGGRKMDAGVEGGEIAVVPNARGKTVVESPGKRKRRVSSRKNANS